MLHLVLIFNILVFYMVLFYDNTLPIKIGLHDILHAIVMRISSVKTVL